MPTKDCTTVKGQIVTIFIDAPPPEKGLVSINTSEGDSILNYSASGNYAVKHVRIRKELDGSISEKSIRDVNGSPDKFRSGLEFTYDPSPGGTKGITAAGLRFNLAGTQKLWQTDPDHPGHLIETTSKETRVTNIDIGCSADIVKKIKNGFSIDYKKALDTTYYNNSGVKNTILHTEEYHAKIIRVNKK